MVPILEKIGKDQDNRGHWDPIKWMMIEVLFLDNKPHGISLF